MDNTIVFGNGKWSQNHQKALRELGIKYTALDIDYMYDAKHLIESNPDAVVVACSTVNHFPILELCLENNVPVFCEKPVCLEKWQLQEMTSWIDINKPLLFMSGHQLLFDETIQALHSKNESLYINCLRTGAIPRTEGAIFSLAVHDIAIIHYLFKTYSLTPVEVQGDSHSSKITLVDSTTKQNRYAEIFVQSIAPVKLRHLSVLKDNGKVKRLAIDNWSKTNLIKKELGHFYSCIANKKTPEINDLQQTCNVMETIFKIIEFNKG